MRIVYWFRRNFICNTIFGNHIPEPYLYETFSTIHTKRCKKCHSILGFGEWKYIPYPSNSTEEQKKSFDKYRLERLDEIRRTLKT